MGNAISINNSVLIGWLARSPEFSSQCVNRRTQCKKN